MSIILKGIDMPEENLRVICLFPHGAEELVVIDADSGATAGRPIQVVQIPKDHGDIIDRQDVFTYCQWDEDALNEVDPILEAEEE